MVKNRLTNNAGLINLGLAASLIFYVALTFIQARYGLFENDFLGFWSVGRLVNAEGYSKIYDLTAVAEYQGGNGSPATVPTPFPAVFILPFQIAALLPLKTAAWLWRFVNLGMLIFYCLFLDRQLRQQSDSGNAYALPALMLSLPVYMNFAWAQVNLFVLIGVGEFIRLRSRQKSFWAGAALGWALIKPQVLVLIAPMLLFQKQWKSLAGLLASAMALATTSVALTGMTGSLQLINLWLKYSSGLPTNEPEHMVNWRMAGINLGALLPPQLAWLVAGLGIVLTASCAVRSWTRQSETSFPHVLLVTFAATLLISWHAHFHYLAMLAPVLFFVALRDAAAPPLIYLWSFSGTAFYFFILLLGIFAGMLSLPAGFGSAMLGGWGFASDLLLLGWAVKSLSGHKA